MESDKKVAPSFHSTPPSAPPPSNGASNAFSRVRPMHGRTTGPTRRSSKGQWTPEEDDILCKAVQRYQGKNWKKIAECFKDRTDVQCLHRWQKVLNPELVKGPWSKEEDEIIIQLVDKYGAKKWSTIAQHLPGRIGKQCRERWHNHLNPGINKEAWTQEEELVLIRAHQINGNRWAELTKYLPGRSDNAIKNHWNSSVKKKLDSYIASGLLAQFEALPAVSHQNHQSMPTASLQMHHNSGDGSICKDGVETEDNSECSQVGGSQSVSDMSNTACQTREDTFFARELDCGNMQTSSPVASGSVQYCPSLDDITFTFSDLPYEFNCPSTYLEDNVSKDPQSYTDGDSRFGSISLPDVSCMELAAEPSDLSRNCLLIESKTENGMSQDTFQSKGDDIVDMDRYRESLQSGFQLSGTGETLALQSYNPLDSECQNPSFSLDDQAGNNLAICIKEHQETDSLCIYQALEVAKNAEQGSNSASPCCGKVGVDLTKQIDEMEPFASEHDVRTLCYEPPLFPSFDIPFFSCDLAQSGSDAPHEYSPLGIRQFMTSSMENLTPFKLWDSPASDDSPNDVLKKAAKSFAITPSILKKRHRDLLSPLSPFSERRYDKKTGIDVNQGFLCTSRLTHEFSRLDVMFNEADPDHSKQPPSPSIDQIDTKSVIEDKENICPTSQGQTGETKYNCDSRDNTSKEEWSKNPTLDMVKKGNFGDNMPRGVLVERPLNDRDVSSQGGAGPNAVLKPIDQGSKITPNKEAISELGNDKAGCVLSSSSLGLQKKTTVSLSGQPVSGVSTEMIDSLVNEVGAENLNIFGGTPFRRSIESPSSWKSPWYFSSLVALPRVDTDITIEDIGIFMSPGMRSVDALGLMKQINYQNANAYEDAREFLGSETPESILRKRSIKNKEHETESNNDVESHQEGRCETPESILRKRSIKNKEHETESNNDVESHQEGGCETPESILRKRSIKNKEHETESNNDVESHQEGRLRTSSDLLTERRILDFSECGAA